MESKEKAAPVAQAPQTPSAAAGNYFKKMTRGAEFLSLEHAGHMALTFVLCIFIIAGTLSAFSMWTGSIGIASVIGGLYQPYFGSGLKAAEALLALMVVVVLAIAPLVYIALDRRTRASWQKRSGYVGRLAYKLPLYVILGLVALGVIICAAHMVYAVVASLALIGVQNAPIGTLYLSVFLPSAIAAIVFGFAFWYLCNLARGRDNGRRYSTAVAIVSGALALALLITAIVVLHNPDQTLFPTNVSNGSSGLEDDSYYQELLDSLYR